MDRLTVVVMAYNEAATIDQTVQEILATGAVADLLIVDDGSTDDTPAIAARLAGDLAVVRVIHHARNGGLGAVYRTGLTDARGDVLTFFPADGQFAASIITDFLPHMEHADLVLGNIDPAGRPLLSRVLSATERWIQRGLFGPVPPFQGILMLRTAKVRALPLVSTGRAWTIVLELVIRGQRAGWRIAHSLTPVRARSHGHSKVQNLRTLASHVRQLLALRLAMTFDSGTR